MQPLQLTVTAIYSDHSETFTTDASTKLMIVNLRTPDLLPTSGWTIAGVQRLYSQPDGTVLIVEGDGSGVYFSCTSYTTPCSGPTGDYSKLSASGGPVVYTRAYPDSSKMFFNSTGRMTSSVDRWGNTTTITYDGSWHVSTIGDPSFSSGFWFAYFNGAFRITPPNANGAPADTARPTSIGYDASGRVTAITDADRNNVQFTYDGSGRLATYRDRRGSITTYHYDPLSWKLTSVDMPQIPVDIGGASTQLATPTVRYRPWQIMGAPTAATGSVYAIAPAIDTSAALVIGAVNDTTRFTADRWGQPLLITDPVGLTTTIARTGPFATSVTDPYNHTSSFVYTNGFLTSSTPYGQPTTNISYDAWGMPSQISGGNRPTLSRFYSTSTHKITTTVAGTYVSTDSIDSRGRVAFSKDAAGHTTTIHYDPTFGNLDSTLAAAGQWTRVRFDGFGRDSAVTALGHPQVVRHIYDRLGRDSLVYDGVHAQPIKYTYDQLFLTTVRDQKGQVYRQDVNALGWATDVYDPADTVSWTRKQSFHYDVGGRVTSWKNERDQWVLQQWDRAGRLTSRRDPLAPADTFMYSADARVVVGSNSVSVDSIRLGDVGADTVVTRIAGQWFKRVHSAMAGRRADTTSLTTSLGAGVLQDRRRILSSTTGMLDTVVVGLSRYHIGYTNELLPDTLQYPGSRYRYDTLTSTHQVYARRYSPTVLNADLDAAFSRHYQYDSLGRITEETEPSPTAGSTILRDYAYTGTGGLRRYQEAVTSAAFSCTGGYGCGYTGGTVTNLFQKYGYGFDEVENLTSQVDSLNGNALTSGTFDAGNRLASWGSDSYTYDNDGNRLAHGSTSYTWSATGRLLQVTNGSNSVEYAYNAFGELVRRKTNGVVDRHFVWDDGQLLLLLNGTGGKIAEYAYLPGGEPLSVTVGNATYFYHTDLRGNVVGVSDGATVYQQINYGPWGNVENQSGFGFDTTRLGWKATMWEGGVANLYYVRNRWYDPASRGFISADPLGIEGGLNTYAYTGNDVVNGRDPDGLFQPEGCVEVKGQDSYADPYPPYTIYVIGWSYWDCSNELPYTQSTVEAKDTPSHVRSYAPPEPPVQSHACGIAKLNLAISLPGDATFFLGGVLPALELVGAGIKELRAARWAAATPRLVRTNRAAVAMARSKAAFWLAGHTVATAYAANYTTTEGRAALDYAAMTSSGTGDEFDFSWKDLVPGWGSYRAFRQMQAACHD